MSDFERPALTATSPGIKILWWILDSDDEPLSLEVAATDVDEFSARYVFDSPGPGRRDRPTGFPTPPPGCYRIEVTVGMRHGAVVEQIVP